MRQGRLKKNKKWGLLKFGFFLCLFLGVFSLIWLRTTVVNLEYELSHLGKQKTDLIREGKIILAKRANAYSIENIEKVAIHELGMDLPEREKVFFVTRAAGAAPYKVSIKSIIGEGPFDSRY